MYTFVPSHLLNHFRGFAITLSQVQPTIFHIEMYILGDFTLHLVKDELQTFIYGILHVTNF